MKEKVYSACVQCVMMYGSETRTVEDIRRMERAEKMMIRRVCGMTLRNRKTSEEVSNRPGTVSMSNLVHQERLRWFGHVKTQMIVTCRNMTVSVAGGRGSGRKTWKECVADNMRQLRLRQEDVQYCTF
jgi:hypothetical protein